MLWEVNLLQMLQEIRNPILTAFMEAITAMAESLFIVILIAILYWCVDKKKSLKIGWIVLFSTAINGIIKNIVKMPRPFQKGVVAPLRVETATSYSFPSGHTQLATAFWGTSMGILKSNGIYLIGSIFIILTAISRLYLGVHWPTDVLGGIIVGIICVLIGGKLINEEGKITRYHVLATSIVFIACVLFPIDEDLAKAVGALWGLTFGAYLEQNYIHFKEQQKFKIQVIKSLIGFSITIGLYVGLKAVLPVSIFSDMIRYALLLLWISGGAPYVFKLLFEKK